MQIPMKITAGLILIKSIVSRCAISPGLKRQEATQRTRAQLSYYCNQCVITQMKSSLTYFCWRRLF